MSAARIMVRRQLGAFAPAWDALVALAPLPSPFLRSWWVEHASRGLPLYLLVVDGHQLLGGLALAEDRVLGVQRLRFLGAGPLCPDHLDLVARADREAEVVAVLGAWLRRPGGRLLDLEGLVHGSRLRSALPRPAREGRPEVAPYTLLPSAADDYLARLPSKARNTLKRTRRRLEAAGARYRVVEPGETDRALRDLRRLHGERWEARSGFLADFRAFAAAVRCGAERGEAVFHELVAGDEVIACEVTFEVAGRASFYQGGRSMAGQWRGAGTVLRAAVIARACELGLTEYDLLRGDEPYKRDWADSSRPLLHLRAASGLSGRTLLLTMLAWESAAAAARRYRAAGTRYGS